MNKIAIILLLLTFYVSTGYGQHREVRGVVSDSLGPVAGATVSERAHPTNMVTTDSAGRFKLVFEENQDSLSVSLVGYHARVLPLGERSYIEVLLHQIQTPLNEVMVIGFGKTNRITNTGAVASIKAEEIRRIPTSSVQNTLAGRMPGFFAQQRSGQPGK